VVQLLAQKYVEPTFNVRYTCFLSEVKLGNNPFLPMNVTTEFVEGLSNMQHLRTHGGNYTL